MPQLLPGPVFRQRAPRRLLRLGHGLDRHGDHRRCRGEPLRLVGFQAFDCQLELLRLARHLLRRAAKLGPPVARQLELQLGDQDLSGGCILRHCRNNALQRRGIIGQGVGRDRHASKSNRCAAAWLA
jgi:hypothetical protein